MMGNLIFSGHDTFHCRQFWLKKAYDFVEEGKSFNDADASITLGVGKNMVTAIRFWSKCFQMIDEDGQPTMLADKLFGKSGWDPYLEDVGSLWLLHYLLVSSKKASTFSLIFNELIKERPEFTADFYQKFVNRKDGDYNQNTLKKDFTVFYRTYYADFKASDIEESFTGILTELDLVEQIKKPFVDKDGKIKARETWVIQRTSRDYIPSEVLLYAILDQAKPDEKSFSFEKLYSEENQIGSVFALSREGLTEALEWMVDTLPYNLTYSSEAGIRELQIKEELSTTKILEDYYG